MNKKNIAELSVCLIVKNEEAVLARALDCAAKIADEIIVADTGSSDKTREIAARFTDKIYGFTWIDDFSAARNFSFSKASCDYIMWLDADDVISDADITAIRNLKLILAAAENSSHTIDAVMLRYNVAHDSGGRVTFSYFRERIVRRAANFSWVEPVHEYLQTGGNVLRYDAAITHGKPPEREGDALSDRNLRIYKRQIERGVPLSPRGKYYYGRELVIHGLYAEAVSVLLGFLGGGDGWSEDNVHACEQLSFCYQKLGEPSAAKCALLRSLLYAPPRGEVCCKIAALYAEDGDFNSALMWYDLAASLKLPDDVIGFIEPEYYGYIPLMEAVVCADKLGLRERAIEYNERAAVLRPDSESVAHNRRYFASGE